MQVNPASGPHQPSHIVPPILQKLDTLWNSWYNEPTHQTGEKLLHFLKHHEADLTKIVGNTPEPFGPDFNETFPILYGNTLTMLSTWVDHCKHGNVPITPPVSELIADIYDWAKAACGS
jgi:hypothetical protein